MLFSFNYNGVSFSELLPTVTACGNDTVYTLPDGLRVTLKHTSFEKYNAERWVVYFENNGNEDSGLISDVFDCDVKLPFNDTYKTPISGYQPKQDNGASVWHTVGSNVTIDEYSSHPQPVSPNAERRYSCSGGRCSQDFAPYFDINEGDRGAIIAIGWSGQWNAVFNGEADSVRIRTGIEALSFRLHPNEKIRTSSVVLLKYENGQNNGHIMFRRLFKEHFSLIGTPGRPKYGPLCITTWGSLPSATMLERIHKISELNIGAECYWVDAGWYGYSEGECPDEFTGDWWSHAGDWNINPNYHPDGFKDVSAALQNVGLDFLLWFESERALKSTDTASQHPDWFLKLDEEDSIWLLNLGNEDAYNGILEMLSEKIETLKLACYRQDFNVEPLPFWRKNDEPERNGINEIKHIMNLYRLWDALLERFPHLYIDNCASGGRRNDIELLSRSIPLWRSDYQCWWDAAPETAQNHNSGISWWIPYSGTGIGEIMGDTYRTRSCYAPAMTTESWMYARQKLDEKTQPIDKVRELFAEYKRVRPFMSCDFYPLTPNNPSDDVWCAWQYNRPEEADGIVLVFRRPKSTAVMSKFELGGLDSNATYIFTDSKGESIEVADSVLTVTLNNPRESELYFYKKQPSC